MYTLTFGEFDEARKEYVEGVENQVRNFTPCFTITNISHDQIVSILQENTPGWEERLLDAWINSEKRPRTFIIGKFSGYRVEIMKSVESKRGMSEEAMTAMNSQRFDLCDTMGGISTAD